MNLRLRSLSGSVKEEIDSGAAAVGHRPRILGHTRLEHRLLMRPLRIGWAGLSE
jgi:hypothetical protein